jgi:short-subunit dehydrogenase
MQRILIYGATSAMAQEYAKLAASHGSSFFLVAREQSRLAAVRDELMARGAHFVAISSESAERLGTAADTTLGDAVRDLGTIDVVLIAYGQLGDQQLCERDPNEAESVILTNFVSVARLLTKVANLLEEQRSGTIAVISSVAGDRGRQSNYVYGSAKAGLSAFLSGLRNRLYKVGVAVVDIRPGFVATPMVKHLKQGPLFADVRLVGNGIFLAIRKKRDIVYLPWFWRWIMLIVKLIPERVFKRLAL